MVMKAWPKWESRVLAVYPEKGTGHAVCAFERPDGMRGFMDDSGVHIIGRAPWEKIAYDVHLSQPKKWACWCDVKGKILVRWYL
jgi:hypothetical protein